MLEINKYYDFNTVAPAILGDRFTGMKLMAILSYKEAIKKLDVANIHDTIKTMVPNMPANPKDLTYLVFKDKDGKDLTIAYIYIINLQVTSIRSIDIRMEVNSEEDVQIVRRALTELGYIFELTYLEEN